MTASSDGGGSTTTAGALAAATWLRTRGITPPARTRWHVEIALDIISDRAPTDYDDASATRFHLNIYTEEWSVYFLHGGRASWIRVTDIAFVHERDEHQLLGLVPALKEIGRLLRRLETMHAIQFQREHAAIHTNLPNAESTIRDWIASL